MSDVARSATLLVLASAVGAATMAIAFEWRDGLVTGALLFTTGAGVLVAAHLANRRRRRLGSLSRQFSAGIAASVGLSLVAVGVTALLMFVSPHDAFTVALLLAFAGLLAAYSASLIARGVMDDVNAIRRGLGALAAGSRDTPIRTEGHDELHELAEAANRMAGELAERERERDEAEAGRRALLAAVSHDLRTPLTSLRVLTEAIEDDMVDAETRRRYLAQMSVHTRSLSALIDDLFELSRLEAGDIEWTLHQVSLGALVEETVESMRVEADASGVDVRFDLGGGLGPARANPEKLQRVLFNLIQNAIRHTPADGSVTVRAQSISSEVEVEVENTGTPIPPDDRDRVFEPFYRGGGESPRTRSGSGLGLTICRAIVEAHGGRIWLGDTDVGTRICFTLPRA